MSLYSDPEDAPNELQRLLLRAVPYNEHGNKTTSRLAELLGVSRWAVQKWIMAQKIPPERALQIVNLSNGRVGLEDFSEFVYKF